MFAAFLMLSRPLLEWTKEVERKGRFPGTCGTLHHKVFCSVFGDLARRTIRLNRNSFFECSVRIVVLLAVLRPSSEGVLENNET